MDFFYGTLGYFFSIFGAWQHTLKFKKHIVKILPNIIICVPRKIKLNRFEKFNFSFWMNYSFQFCALAWQFVKCPLDGIVGTY